METTRTWRSWRSSAAGHNRLLENRHTGVDATLDALFGEFDTRSAALRETRQQIAALEATRKPTVVSDQEKVKTAVLAGKEIPKDLAKPKLEEEISRLEVRRSSQIALSVDTEDSIYEYATANEDSILSAIQGNVAKLQEKASSTLSRKDVEAWCDAATTLSWVKRLCYGESLRGGVPEEVRTARDLLSSLSGTLTVYTGTLAKQDKARADNVAEAARQQQRRQEEMDSFAEEHGLRR